MKVAKLSVIVFGIIICSCSKKNDEGEIFILSSFQHNAIEVYSAGEEQLAIMEEMVEDKTNY